MLKEYYRMTGVLQDSEKLLRRERPADLEIGIDPSD